MAHCKPQSASFGNGVDSDTMLACAAEWMPKLEDLPKPALRTCDPLCSWCSNLTNRNLCACWLWSRTQIHRLVPNTIRDSNRGKYMEAETLLQLPLCTGDPCGLTSILLIIGRLEQLKHLLLGRLVGIREAACILHGIGNQRREVLRLSPELLDILRDAQLLVEVLDGLQDNCDSLVLVLADLDVAHRMGNVDEQLRHILGIVGLHHREQHGVAHTVWCVVVGTQLVGHGMHIAQAGRVEGHAG
mmetsp:Transcript_84559/g.229513  ORF Transcript_84559/g.229513 Transcript_84559/m.229513 type:complete len:244 (-) Transcript_84559:979-1710(-)